MGPFFLVDLLGLDTVLHVAEYLNEQLGDRFYVHEGMQRLVGDKQLGAKTGGSGFYKEGEAQIEGEGDPPEELPDLMGVKAVREACLVLEEGVAQARAIDLGMMAGAGMEDRKSTRLNSSHANISYAVFCLTKKHTLDPHHSVLAVDPPPHHRQRRLD